MLALAVLSVFFLASKKSEHTLTVTDKFDTVITVKTYSASDNTKDYNDIITRADSEFSSDTPGAQIYELNRNRFCEISEETKNLLCDAAAYSQQLGDYFDISVEPLCRLWDIKNNPGKIPDGIKDSLKLVGINALDIDIAANTAKLTQDGAMITLGAIAKGYTTDLIVSKMRQNAEESALVNMGGNIYALGRRPDGERWNIAIADPKNPEENAAVISVENKAVVTSGNYERYVVIDGKRYHHIINPNTGYPAESGLLSATAVGDKAELCDVLSTAMFASGAEKAAELAKRYLVDAILISDDTLYYTKGLENIITEADGNYNFVPIDVSLH